MPTNRLANEASPYLQQHKHNPVDWYPWGEEAFAKAREENKPIFLSIGYSTCHWCHVMERESFENESVAEILNREFVSIKVDREERPDVDRIYMLFVQATTGGGGWPMSVWLTPELKPFYGGTYFPPDNRYGRPGFPSVLLQLAQIFRDDRDRVEGAAKDVMAQLESHAAWNAQPADSGVADRLFTSCQRTFDKRFAGFGTAPKFPRPVQLNFLLRYYKAEADDDALAMVVKTLKAMARGGMNDQLGGGFHRYSVDARWFVPHFEKMLYDQAQLAVSYLEAFQITGDPELAAEARRIFTYVLRDMTHKEGGFFSAEDADSVINPADPHHKGEGAFYVFEARELVAVLGEEEARRFAEAYGCLAEGNVAAHEDPHEEFPRKNILFRAVAVEDTFEEATAKLLSYRNLRIRPGLDDKILTSWNGLMISAFAKGAQVLGDPAYELAARRAAAFILSHMRNDGGVLLRRWRAGEAAIPGFLDDYASFGLALVDLYETGLRDEDLDGAIDIAGKMVARFADPNGGFFSTAGGDPSLVMRLKEDYDGAEPSGNSLAVLLLLRLAAITGRADFDKAARDTLAAFGERLNSQTAAVPQMVCALMLSLRTPRQIEFAGANVEPLLKAVHAKFAPFQVLLRAAQRDGEAEARLCENFVCQLPLRDAAALSEKVE